MYPNNFNANGFRAPFNHPPAPLPHAQIPPPLVYHFRGLRIDESMPNGLGRRAYVMRRQPQRDHRVQQYIQPHWGRRTRQRSNQPANRQDGEDSRCFICGEVLQNSAEPGVHLCAGTEPQADQSSQPDTADKDDVDLTHLQEMLDGLKKALKNNDAIKNLGSCVKNLDVHTKTIDKELEKLQKEHSKKTDLSSRRTHRCLVTARQNMAAWRILVQKAAEEAQRRESLCDARDKSLDAREKEIIQQKLESEGEIRRQIQELEDEKERLSELHEAQKGRIKLDVGGKVFTTSLSTLTRDSESMLAAMFSGRHQIVKEKDGCVFIDRDGTNFRFILNYLRDGAQALSALPKSRQSLRELRNEAVYYQLFGLVQKIEKLI